MKASNLLKEIISLCKRRGFIYPGSEIYGGFFNTYSYGPYGTELKKNIKDRIDVVIVYSPPLPLAIVGEKIKRQSGARLILNVQDLSYHLGWKYL